MPPRSMSTALDTGRPMIDPPSRGEWQSINWSRRYGSTASRSQPYLVMITSLLSSEGVIVDRNQFVATCSPVFSGVPYVGAHCEVIAMIVPRRLPKWQRPRCGAKTRRGTPCQCQALPNGRCKLHGGMLTGAKTPEGRAKIAAATRRRWAEYRRRKATMV